MFGIRKKLMSKAEDALGFDLDGDGQCGSSGQPGMDRNSMIRQAFLDALKEGVQNAVGIASRSGGFLENPAVRIPWPPELSGHIEEAAQRFLPDIYDRFVTTLNRSAEEASATALDVLINAIMHLDVSAAVNLITSSNQRACTDYFKETSHMPLYQGMRPIIDRALEVCDVTSHWDD
eukprot:gene18492-28538_t